MDLLHPRAGAVPDRLRYGPATDTEEHLFPPAGPLPEFEGGLVTPEELRVLLGRDVQD